MNTVLSPARLGALLVKEFIQMRRDRVTFAMMLGVPLMLLVLFGFAINNDPKRLPAALLAMSNDQYTRAMVVGDSVWDMLAAQRARALGIGVLSGGYGEDELARAGAFRVYEDPADMLRRIDEVAARG